MQHPFYYAVCSSFPAVPIIASMALVGHLARQVGSVQVLQMAESTTARLFSILIASCGQFRMQRPQPRQALLQDFLATAPLSCELQLTSTGALNAVSAMICCGQVCTHLPHPVHFALSTTGRPSSPIWSASKGHTRTQLPKPIQPNLHAFGPPWISLAAAQSGTP